MKSIKSLRCCFLMCTLIIFLGNNFAQVEYDNSFATNGRFFYNEIGTLEEAVSVMEQPDGKVVAIGYTNYDPDEGDNYRIIVIRLNPNGTYDNSFGVNGKVYIDTPNSTDFPYNGTLQADGKILISGRWKTFEAVLYRLNSNGSMDNSFGTNGVADIGGYILDFNVKVQSNGKIVTSGTGLLNGYSAYLIARFNSNGLEFDNTFNNGTGYIRFRTSTSNAEEDTEAGQGLTILPNGKILSCGDNEKNDGTVIRLNPNGTLDQTWGTGGIRKIDFTRRMYLSSVGIQDDGKVVVGGTYDYSSSLYKAQVMRFLPNGNFDTTFDGYGFAWYGNSGGFGFGDKMVVQCDGKILIGGGTYLFRIGTSGDLDPSFGNNGFFTVSAADFADSKDIFIGESSIYLTGSCRPVSSGSDLQIFAARLTNDINCSTTQANELYPDIAFSISPNPVTDLLTINIEIEHAREFNIKIVDVIGHVIWASDEFTQNTSTQCDLKALVPGIYYAIVSISGKTRTLPFIKN